MKGKRTISKIHILRQISIIRSALYGQYCLPDPDGKVLEALGGELIYYGRQLQKGVPFSSSDHPGQSMHKGDPKHAYSTQAYRPTGERPS